MNKILLFIILFIATSCAGPNPNPGERTADNNLVYGDKKLFASLSEKHAKKGEPWALLRAGIAYDYGFGVEKDLPKAKYYLIEVTKFYKSNPSWWQSGIMIGAIGKSGFFNSNTDALLGYYHLANIFYKKNPQEALKNINFVIEHSKSQSLFFCCEFAGGLGINQEQIIAVKNKIIEHIN
jgi:hypothetical protein